MSAPTVDVFGAPDLVELLRDQPELLAVADAIALTPHEDGRRSWLARLAVGGAVAAVIVGLLLLSPWRIGHEPSLTNRALAAVGSGPIIHAVIEVESRLTSIDLASGQERRLVSSYEIWFDEERHVEHTLSRTDGQLESDALQTPTEWITADHRDPTGTPPVLDPALAEFVDGYRAALENGKAVPLGDGSVDGHQVTWLGFDLGEGRSERVAIDKSTSLPLRVETTGDAESIWTYSVRTIEALPKGSGNFTPPRALPTPRPYSFMREPSQISPADALSLMPNSVAVGPAIGGLELARVRRAKLSTLYEPATGKEPDVSWGLEFEYGNGSLADGLPFLWIEESTAPQPAYDWRTPLTPAPGELVVMSERGFPTKDASSERGLIVKNGLYITIVAPDRRLLLDAARSLRPFAEG